MLNLLNYRKVDKMLKICEELFKQLSDRNIIYCHWKSIEHLDEGLNGETDLDMLFMEKDSKELRNIFKGLKIVEVKPQQGSKFQFVEDWIGFDRDTGKLIHIHLHYRIVAGKHFVKEYILPWHEIILKNRVYNKDNNTYIINPNIELLLLITRAIIKIPSKKVVNEHYQFPKDIKKEIDYLYKRINKEEIERYSKVFFENYNLEISKILLEYNLSSKYYDELYNLIIKEIKQYKRYSEFKVKIMVFFYKYYYKTKNFTNKKIGTINVTRKTISDKGFSVCFIGADGCGKSTLSTEIRQWLSWKIECNRFYLGSGDGYNGIYKKIRKLREKTNTGNLHKKNTEVEEQKNVFSLKKYMSSIYRGLEYVHISKRNCRIIRKIKRYNRKGGISILDRFPQNQVDGIYDGKKCVKLLNSFTSSRLINYLVKKERKYMDKAVEYQPELVFKLILDPKISIERKPEHNYEEVLLKSKITEILEFKNSMVEIIDASMDYNDEVKIIKEKIWKKIVENSKY